MTRFGIAAALTLLAGCSLMGLYDAPPAVECPAGTDDCDGECRDLDNDPENCGTCGNECDVSEQCDNGCSCRPGLVDCEGKCIAPGTDPEHCGGCSEPACAAAEVCSEGSCGGTCAPDAKDCDGACVDTERDVLNCGFCGTACNVDQLCFSGKCWDYSPATGCDGCAGCNACAAPEVCCDDPGYGAICVDAEGTCPP